MKILIVHAHNEPHSFCSAMKEAAADVFCAGGHEVVVSDLYAMQWNPVATSADFGERANPDYLVYALEQRHNQQKGSLAPDIQAELDKLLWADRVIFNFPLYWFSVPAILKGWFDRVLVSGVCYGGKRFYDQGGLAGKKALLALTAGAQPHMLAEDGVHGALNDMLRPLLRGTLAYTGMEVLPPFVAWHVPYICDADRQAILQQYRDYLQQMESTPSLTFVSLRQFDERLRPLGAAGA